MQTVPFDMIADLAMDPSNGWSIGSFGAIGEFVRDEDEPATIGRETGLLEIATARGAMRIAPTEPLTGIAWDSLSSDGESWGHALAFCCAQPVSASRVIRHLGNDRDAIRGEDRASRLFDLGVGSGIVVMALRTSDAALIAAMEALEGQSLLSTPAIMGDVLRAQPHRVLLSPAGRIEVFQPIPPADGKSPEGPHTHLMMKLVPKDRPHSSNIPIPSGQQAALSLHPRSPWRTMLGERHDYRAEIDDAFAGLLDRFSLPADKAVADALCKAIESGATPEFAEWPDSRRGRTKARIMLRRMAAAGDVRVTAWRAFYDRAALEDSDASDEKGRNIYNSDRIEN